MIKEIIEKLKISCCCNSKCSIGEVIEEVEDFIEELTEVIDDVKEVIEEVKDLKIKITEV